MNNTTNERKMDIDLSNGLGLHMILIWGRVALVQGIPAVYANNSMLIVVCTMLLVLYYFFILFIKYKHIPNINIGAAITAFFVLVTLTYTLVVWPNNKQYMDPIGNTIFYEVCPFCILSMIRNVEVIYEPMVKASRILLVLCTISSIGILMNDHTTVSTWSAYSMPLSYATLYAVMWLMCDYFNNKNKVSTLILLVIGILILVVFGSRNTLLSVAAYLAVIIIRSKENDFLRKSFLMISLVLFFLLWNPIINTMNTIVLKLGIRSRTLKLFIEHDYFADDRIMIHHNIFEVINSHPFGVGIAGDVAQTHEFAHGLYVSILCTYGYVIGALVIIAIAAVLIKAYKKSSGLSRDILVIYAMAVLPRGFTGGDVWSSDVFWWMLGIACSIICFDPLLTEKYDVI